jgi:hypothetical protein
MFIAMRACNGKPFNENSHFHKTLMQKRVKTAKLKNAAVSDCLTEMVIAS